MADKAADSEILGLLGNGVGSEERSADPHGVDLVDVHRREMALC
jgi:hypothetical protein